MTPEELGHLTALRNLLHGAPMSQNVLAGRLLALDRLLHARRSRFRLTRDPDYWTIAGSLLDRLDQRR